MKKQLFIKAFRAILVLVVFAGAVTMYDHLSQANGTLINLLLAGTRNSGRDAT